MIPPPPWTFGFTAEGTRLDISFTAPDMFDPASYQGRVYSTDYPFPDLATPEVGHYLVRTAVPEPAATAALLALAALLAAFRLKRRNW